VAKAPAAKKPRVYEIAKEFGMSSEAVLQIVKRLGAEVKNHMSTLTPEMVEKIKGEVAQERAVVKEEQARKHEIEAHRAREERARHAAAHAAAAAASAAAPAAAASAPARPAPPRPPVVLTPADRRLRRRDRKKKKQVDEKLVQESVRKTLASLDVGHERRRYRREDGAEAAAPTEEAKVIKVSEFITVAELAGTMGVKPQDVIAACMRLGLMVTINRRLDKASIEAVADEFGFAVQFLTEYGEEEVEEKAEVSPGLEPRAPVVTVMGHVDHGKTSLLDYIRKTNVIAGEAGGITQHIGAYDVELPGGKKICFLDTPGHEAFSAMRARGAQVTDIVVLVVAADDRVMPQTLEAIDHARAAGVPLVVAINKIDLPAAKPDLVKQELAGHGVVVEEYGGKTVCVEISAKRGTNVERLMEMILLVADLLDLRSDPQRPAKGTVLEARVEQGRGIVASVLVQNGKLHIGDVFLAGQHSGRVRAMFDERARQVREAGPSTPVELLGWSGVPQAGDALVAMEDERQARELATKRQALHREQEFRQSRHVSLADLYQQIEKGELGELKLVLKGDVDGSVEALSEALTKLATDEVKVRVLRQGVGQISESDVLLAAASDALIVGFHVRPDPQARELAQSELVEIRLYDVIYQAVDEVKQALAGLLKPELKETVLGAAEVREVFRLSKAGVVAGCYVLSGNIPRSAKVRLRRGEEIVFEGRIASLKRFKDDVREVQNGLECGIALEGFNDVHAKDVIEAFMVEELARTLD
jgi:translation initiation factor IF-2